MLRMSMFISTSPNRLFPFAQMLIDTLQVRRQIEPGLLQVVQQTVNGTYARVYGRSFAISTYGEEEERYQAETVV